jgi:phosphoserine phosphatase
MRPVAFLDLDDTLLDTGAFKQRLWTYFGVQTGHTSEEVEEAYAQARAVDGGYSIQAHLSALYSREISGDGVQEFMAPVLEQLPELLFTGVFETIDRLRELGYSPIILTKGNHEFQQMKLSALSDLVACCDEAHIVPEYMDKGEYVQQAFGELHQPLLVDDKIDTLTSFREAYPDANTFSTIKDVIGYFEPKEYSEELSTRFILR